MRDARPDRLLPHIADDSRSKPRSVRQSWQGSSVVALRHDADKTRALNFGAAVNTQAIIDPAEPVRSL